MSLFRNNVFELYQFEIFWEHTKQETKIQRQAQILKRIQNSVTKLIMSPASSLIESYWLEIL